MTSEKNPAENVPQNQSQAPQNSESAEAAKRSEPLATYEKVNADAPVTTARMIAERLAKKKTENAAADGAAGPSSPLAGKLQYIFDNRRDPQKTGASAAPSGQYGSRSESPR